MRTDFLIKCLIVYSVVRPVFYIHSYFAGRISDLTILALGILVLLLVEKIPKISDIYFFWFVLFESLICFSLLINSYSFELTFKDFVEIARPAYLFVGVLLGLSLVRGRIDKFDNLIKIVIGLSVASSLVGLIQFVFKDTSISNFFYYLYNVPNLLEKGRPGGFTYIHYGYTAFSFLAPLFLISKTLVLKNKKYILPIAIFTALSLLSLSRGGVIFIIITLFSFFGFYVLLSPKKFYGFITSLKSFFRVGFPLLVLIVVLVFFFPYLYHGFQAIFRLETANISVGHRINDILTAIEWVLKDGLHFLIGYSPLRNYPEISYIETSFFNILFRFGIVGLFLYYSFFILPIFKFIRIKNFIFKENRYFFSQCVAVISMVVGLIATDLTVNLSESIKFSFIVAVILGGIMSVLKLELEEVRTKVS